MSDNFTAYSSKVKPTEMVKWKDTYGLLMFNWYYVKNSTGSFKWQESASSFSLPLTFI